VLNIFRLQVENSSNLSAEHSFVDFVEREAMSIEDLARETARSQACAIKPNHRRLARTGILG
jgi:hypothetical protein